MTDKASSGVSSVFSSAKGTVRLQQNDKGQSCHCLARATFGLVLCMLVPLSAAAEPKSIEDCEKIQAADAYNQCLASFGPVAHERGVTADPEGASGGHSSGAAAEASAGISSSHGSRHHGRYQYQPRQHQYARRQDTRHQDPWAHMRHARQHIEFQVR